MEARLDHFDVYGDVYQALETCQVLEMNLDVLRRQQLVGESEWIQVRKSASEIRSSLEAILAA
jgi:hypothetical protein